MKLSQRFQALLNKLQAAKALGMDVEETELEIAEFIDADPEDLSGKHWWAKYHLFDKSEHEKIDEALDVINEMTHYVDVYTQF